MSSLSSYERISQSLLKKQEPHAPFCIFDAETKRLLIGTQSLHRTASSRIWRTFWRIKKVRPAIIA